MSDKETTNDVDGTMNTEHDLLSHAEGNTTIESRETMLSTVDNPYNPFDEFDSWYNYDVSKGYNSCAYLARIAYISDDATDAVNNSAIESAIDEIVQLDILNKYIKVVRS